MKRNKISLIIGVILPMLFMLWINPSVFAQRYDAIYVNKIAPNNLNNMVYVMGTMSIGGWSTNNYTFPTTRGTTNQILKLNSSGLLQWSSLPTSMAFADSSRASHIADLVDSTHEYTTFKIDTVDNSCTINGYTTSVGPVYCNNGIEVNATMTVDLLFHNSESIDNNTNGTLNMKSAALSASLYNFVVAANVTGVADSIILNTVPDITIAIGTKIGFINEIANTTNVVINVDGLGYVALEEYAEGTQNALDSNDMIIGQYCEIVWNGTAYVLISAH